MHRPRPLRPAGALFGLVVLLAACGGGAGGSEPATDPVSDPAETGPATVPSTPTAEPSESMAPTDGGSGGEAVTVGDMSFSPAELTVPVGTTVTFTNSSALPHTITHGTGGRPADDAAFDRPISPDGGTVNITFDEPGTYDITCKLHSSMQMRVVVEG